MVDFRVNIMGQKRESIGMFKHNASEFNLQLPKTTVIEKIVGGSKIRIVIIGGTVVNERTTYRKSHHQTLLQNHHCCKYLCYLYCYHKISVRMYFHEKDGDKQIAVSFCK